MRDANYTPKAAERPCLVLRVGVTGHRDLERGVDGTVSHQLLGRTIGGALARIASISGGLCEADRGDGYAGGKAQMRVVSALAVGADQIVAAHGIALGWQLEALLPFSASVYRRDFTEPELGQPSATDNSQGGTRSPKALFEASRSAFPDATQLAGTVDLASGEAAFDTLLHAAGERVVALDGSTLDLATRNYSYRAVGQLIVSRSDIVVALWDGKRASGVGGTGDVVEDAVNAGRPVLWIEPTQPDCVRLILRPDQLPWWRSGAPTEEEGDPFEDVTKRLAARLLLPLGEASAALTGSPLRRIVSWPRRTIRTLIHSPRVTLSDYLSETDLERGWFGSLFDIFYNWVGRAKSPVRPPPGEGPASPSGPAFTYLQSCHRRANAYAVKYSNLYRSSYLAIFILAALALSSAIVAVAFDETKWVKPTFTIIEALLLLVLLVTFTIAHKRSWHRRWLSYRLLAELLRPAAHLALIGRQLTVQQPVGAGPPGGEYGWAIVYFQALVRNVPADVVALTPQRLAQVKGYVSFALVEDQRNYQYGRAHGYANAGLWLLRTGIYIFIATAAVVTVKLLGIAFHLEWTKHPLLSIWAGILPAFGAATFAIRQQAEFEVIEHRSHALAEVLERTKQRVAAVDVTVPLASERLGQEISHVTEHMVAELYEWMSIFVSKPPEVA